MICNDGWIAAGGTAVACACNADSDSDHECVEACHPSNTMTLELK